MDDYQRILIKISGEALGGNQGAGLDDGALQAITGEIIRLVRAGKQIAMVVGAGNFFRGAGSGLSSVDRVDADYMGMLGTVMNAVALKNYFVAQGQEAAVMSALRAEKIVEPLYPPKARMYLDQGKVVIFAGGTGNPYFTTDTAGVLRALEIKADVMFKGTKVDGVYTADPAKDPSARKYDVLSFEEALEKRLAIMDATAFALARENKLPIVVYNMKNPGTLSRIVLEGAPLGTLVR